nr:MAG TPA: protein of unknown function (DUF5589) [Caudoviricetes sp.]
MYLLPFGNPAFFHHKLTIVSILTFYYIVKLLYIFINDMNYGKGCK